MRLLNAAMVNGYSIVTYQRPLKASDELDLPISTNGSQAIIWAIGPLNEKQEVSFHHNAYLKTDRFIDFGRPPAWNCPMPDQEGQVLSYGDANETTSYNQVSHDPCGSFSRDRIKDFSSRNIGAYMILSDKINQT